MTQVGTHGIMVRFVACLMIFTYLVTQTSLTLGLWFVGAAIFLYDAYARCYSNNPQERAFGKIFFLLWVGLILGMIAAT